MFTLTPAAAEQIRQAAATQDDGAASIELRVAAKIEDGEIVYGMGFDSEREHDAVVETCGITVLIAPRSLELLGDATLDFVELQPGEFQFIFINPAEPTTGAGGSCASRQGGCGSCGGGCG